MDAEDESRMGDEIDSRSSKAVEEVFSYECKISLVCEKRKQVLKKVIEKIRT